MTWWQFRWRSTPSARTLRTISTSGNSGVFETALADTLHRLARTRLAREAATLNPAEEKRLAEDALADALDAWPEY